MGIEAWKAAVSALEAELDEKLGDADEAELQRLMEKAAQLSEQMEEDEHFNPDVEFQKIEEDEPEDPESEEYYQWMLVLDAAEACLEEVQDASGQI